MQYHPDIIPTLPIPIQIPANTYPNIPSGQQTKIRPDAVWNIKYLMLTAIFSEQKQADASPKHKRARPDTKAATTSRTSPNAKAGGHPEDVRPP